MRLSKKGEYALRSLINLGFAEESGRTLVQVSELADKEQLPFKFLEAIMNALKENGFVKSERGKYGGFRLSRPASTITLGSVVRAIDGPLAPIRCVSQSAYEPCSCPDETHCGLRMLMLDVRNAISGILDRYTLADVVGVTVEKMRGSNLRLPFSKEAEPANQERGRLRPARHSSGRGGRPTANEAEGVLYRLLGHYSI
jgi:Rrf2 family protein